jgi:hypothetical protein
MHDSLQETNSVDKFGAHSGVCGDGNDALENRGGSNVSKSDAVANEEGTGAQMSFEGDEAAQLAISEEGVDLHGVIKCEWSGGEELTYAFVVGKEAPKHPCNDIGVCADF